MFLFHTVSQLPIIKHSLTVDTANTVPNASVLKAILSQLYGANDVTFREMSCLEGLQTCLVISSGVTNIKHGVQTVDRLHSK